MVDGIKTKLIRPIIKSTNKIITRPEKFLMFTTLKKLPMKFTTIMTTLLNGISKLNSEKNTKTTVLSTESMKKK